MPLKDLVRRREYIKIWCKKNKGKVAIHRHRWYEKNRERVSIYAKKYAKEHPFKKYNWRKLNPLKIRVENISRRAIYNGILKRQPCEICGSKIVHGHHDDYSKPLEVRWLCPLHHAQWHRKRTEWHFS